MIKKISVMAADIDGTLIPKGGKPMPKTQEAMRRLHNDGVKIGLASGRPYDRRIFNLSEEWGLGFSFDFVIGMNGGDLYDAADDTTEHYFTLKKEDVYEIISHIEHLDLNAIVYNQGYDDISALRMDDFMRDSIRRNHSHVTIGDARFLARFDTGKIEVHLKPALEPEFMRICDSFKTDRWNIVATFKTKDHVTLEFQDPRVNKGLGILGYASKHGIDMSEVIAFGDLDNDIGLLKEAGWGVCLVNGSDATKAISQAITEYPVTEDGVGRYLEDHWFNK